MASLSPGRGSAPGIASWLPFWVLDWFSRRLFVVLYCSRRAASLQGVRVSSARMGYFRRALQVLCIPRHQQNAAAAALCVAAIQHKLNKVIAAISDGSGARSCICLIRIGRMLLCVTHFGECSGSAFATAISTHTAGCGLACSVLLVCNYLP